MTTISLMVVFYQFGTPDTNAYWFGVTAAATDTSPFHQYAIKATGFSNLAFAFNTNPSQFEIDGGAAPSAGALHVAVATLTSGSQALYLDGVSVGTNTQTVTSVGNAGTPQLCVGAVTSDINFRNPQAIVLDARVYAKALTASQALEFCNWEDLYLCKRRRRGKRPPKRFLLN